MLDFSTAEAVGRWGLEIKQKHFFLCLFRSTYECLHVGAVGNGIDENRKEQYSRGFCEGLCG